MSADLKMAAHNHPLLGLKLNLIGNFIEKNMLQDGARDSKNSAAKKYKRGKMFENWDY